MTVKTKPVKWTKKSAYEDLKKRIVLQDLAPGEPLYEKELMEKYEIGRTPLREVLLDLKRARFVQMIPNRGTFVSPMDINEIKSVMEMRVPLETLAGRLAVDRITAKEIESLESILSSAKKLEYKDGDDYSQLLLFESNFHNEIYKATHNDLLNETLHQIQTISLRFWMYVTNGGEDIYPHFEDLRALLDAIKKKDKPSVVKIIKAHITRTYEMIKQHI